LDAISNSDYGEWFCASLNENPSSKGLPSPSFTEGALIKGVLASQQNGALQIICSVHVPFGCAVNVRRISEDDLSVGDWS